MEFFDFNGKVVLEFYASGCFNCQMMTPIINNLEHQMPDIRFYRINADVRTDLVQQYHVTSIPSLLLFRNGQLVATIIGVKAQQTLRTLINQALNYA